MPGPDYNTAPLSSKEDKDIFFLCRKDFAPDDSKIDEATYDTASIESVDLFPYLITMGYKTEKERRKVSKQQCEAIKTKRKKYGLSPLVKPYSKKRLHYCCKSLTEKEIKSNWKMYTYGRGKGNLPVVWNNIGALDSAFMKKIVNDPKAGEAAQLYCVDVLEQITRTKLKLSKKHGKRITKHYCVMDVSNLGLSSVNSVKSFVDATLADASAMYPESLEKQYIYNAGWVFRSIWSIVKGFIHPLTREKIELLKDFKTLKKKLAEDGITEIPTDFGGTGGGAVLAGDNVFDAPGYVDPNAPEDLSDESDEEHLTAPPPLMTRLSRISFAGFAEMSRELGGIVSSQLPTLSGLSRDLASGLSPRKAVNKNLVRSPTVGMIPTLNKAHKVDPVKLVAESADEWIEGRSASELLAIAFSGLVIGFVLLSLTDFSFLRGVVATFAVICLGGYMLVKRAPREEEVSKRTEVTADDAPLRRSSS